MPDDLYRRVAAVLRECGLDPHTRTRLESAIVAYGNARVIEASHLALCSCGASKTWRDPDTGSALCPFCDGGAGD